MAQAPKLSVPQRRRLNSWQRMSPEARKRQQERSNGQRRVRRAVRRGECPRCGGKLTAACDGTGTVQERSACPDCGIAWEDEAGRIRVELAAGNVVLMRQSVGTGKPVVFAAMLGNAPWLVEVVTPPDVPVEFTAGALRNPTREQAIRLGRLNALAKQIDRALTIRRIRRQVRARSPYAWPRLHVA